MPKLSTSDWVLLAYLILLVPSMLVGFGFARRKLFVPHHKLTMTTITIINWILIILIMAVTYEKAVRPGVPQDLNRSPIFIPTLHAIFGLSAQLLATYLVIRMWFEKVLPAWFKVRNIKIYMRTTLGLWLLTALFGLATWAVFNRDFLSSFPSTALAGTEQATPAHTQEATAQSAPARTAASTRASTKAATPVTTSAATTAVTHSATRAATQPATPATTQAATPASTQDATQPATPASTPAATAESNRPAATAAK